MFLTYTRESFGDVFFFFFFQAEDGIRDYKVTGVQTCALPICAVSNSLGNSASSSLANRARSVTVPVPVAIWLPMAYSVPLATCRPLSLLRATTASGSPEWKRCSTRSKIGRAHV